MVRGVDGQFKLFPVVWVAQGEPAAAPICPASGWKESPAMSVRNAAFPNLKKLTDSVYRPTLIVFIHLSCIPFDSD
jgi:hypothetical protein